MPVSAAMGCRGEELSIDVREVVGLLVPAAERGGAGTLVRMRTHP
jgi:hypothetical protein